MTSEKSGSTKHEILNKLNPLIPILLLIGIGTIGFNIKHKYERYYTGEPLVFKQIIIKDKPEYIYSRRKISRYTFSGTNYNCRFWISEGALDLIHKEESVKSEIENINTGDTILIGIRINDENKLNDSLFRPRVIELNKSDRRIITADTVQENDKKGYNLNIRFGVISLVLGLILLTRQLSKINEVK